MSDGLQKPLEMLEKATIFGVKHETGRDGNLSFVNHG